MWYEFHIRTECRNYHSLLSVQYHEILFWHKIKIQTLKVNHRWYHMVYSCTFLLILCQSSTIYVKWIVTGEAERIKRCKGRVFALQDEPEVPRVWLPFDDAPGLAMARAFGDFCLKEYGVISIPEFSHRLLTEKDQFIVLASDGVWFSSLNFSPPISFSIC